MKIGGLIKTSLVDYPGKVACSIFTIGCNFRCGFCHNPELVDPIRYIQEIPEELVFEFLEKRKDNLDGVAISGGEPTVQPDLAKFLRRVKKLGLLVKLDSNGSNPDVLEDLFGQNLVDFIAMDVKGPIEKYESIMGWPAGAKCKRSIDLILASGISHEFRTTVVKGMLEVEDFEEVGQLVQGAERFALQHFRAIPEMVNTEEYKDAKTFTEGEFEQARKIMARYVKKVVVH
ncbi:anaerobic ribonucleoside-triphosphate reductase activating protein [Candidatus Saccharibacteria bacterium]|nr:anaerobic ribonucleoside-triphosphate reductase activating protein [Candidatus Saccharibacteria bacterium]